MYIIYNTHVIYYMHAQVSKTLCSAWTWHGQCTIINIQVMWKQYSSCTVYFTYVDPVQQLMFNIKSVWVWKCDFLATELVNWWRLLLLPLFGSPGGVELMAEWACHNASPSSRLVNYWPECRNMQKLHIQCIMYVGMYWYVHHACNNK